MQSKQTTRLLCEGAIMVALAVVLNFLEFDLFAQGGSMNLLFIPLMVFALRRGPVWGMGAGLVFGVLKAVIGGGIAYGWQSLLLDSALAYALPARRACLVRPQRRDRLGHVHAGCVPRHGNEERVGLFVHL